GFSAEAAEAVCDRSTYPEPSTFCVLQSLRDKSLLRTEGDVDGARRLCLFLSIRAYAEEKLPTIAAGMNAAERHADFWARWADDKVLDALKACGSKALGAIAAERENLLAAVDRSLARNTQAALDRAARLLLA